MITTELQLETPPPGARQTQVLRLIGVAPSSWHRVPRERQRKRPGPPPRPLSDEVVSAVVEMATANPWYGYKKIADMIERDDSLRRQIIAIRERLYADAGVPA